jgi:aminoglycoside phosphotransferase (APT) family kinase protein
MAIDAAATHAASAPQALHPLLDHLAQGRPREEHTWQDWRITPIAGGRNNLLYRATGSFGDLAVKFTLRDARDRAGREYGALLALQAAGLDLAPAPVLLDRKRYPLPVVVQTWLAGEVSAVTPATDAEWHSLIEHFVRIHTVARRGATVRLPATVLDVCSAADGLRAVRGQLARLPRTAQPAALQALVRKLEATRFPRWSRPAVALCRGDSNISNFVRRPGGWASVDWEYAGWGDPAFDVADLSAHAAYADVPRERWDWVFDQYCAMAGSPAAIERIRVYGRIMAVWWVARIVRYQVEVPQGQDRRLVAAPEGWEADMQAKYEHYVRMAEMPYG